MLTCFKTQVCVNAEEKKKNTGLNFHGLSHGSSQLSTQSLNAVFVSETRPNIYESTLPGTPPFPARAGPGTPLPSVVTEPQSQQRQKPGPEGSAQHYFRKKMFP